MFVFLRWQTPGNHNVAGEFWCESDETWKNKNTQGVASLPHRSASVGSSVGPILITNTHLLLFSQSGHSQPSLFVFDLANGVPWKRSSPVEPATVWLFWLPPNRSEAEQSGAAHIWQTALTSGLYIGSFCTAVHRRVGSHTSETRGGTSCRRSTPGRTSWPMASEFTFRGQTLGKGHAPTTCQTVTEQRTFYCTLDCNVIKQYLGRKNKYIYTFCFFSYRFKLNTIK